MLTFPFTCKGPQGDDCTGFGASDHGSHARKVVHFAPQPLGN